MKPGEIEKAIKKHFHTLLSPVTVISKPGEPLKVRFITVNVPIKFLSAEPTYSGFAMQVFDHDGKQMGTISRLRAEWNWEDPVSNTMEIERFMLKGDFPEGTEFPKEIYDPEGKRGPEPLNLVAQNSFRSIFTVPEDLK